LNSVWPIGLPKRDVAGLPALCVEALAIGRRKSRLANAATGLDRLLPMWPERAAEDVAAAARVGLDESMQRLCAVLSQRPIGRPQVLIQAAGSVRDPDWKLWLLTALAGTDTPEARAFWVGDLRERARVGPARPDAALWYAFLRALHGGWLTYTDFRDCLTHGRVLAAADVGGDYPPALAKVGLASHTAFIKWYRQVIYEVAHQPDVGLSFETGGWIRDFPGEDYLWMGVAGLNRKADDWWALHLVRYASGIDTDDPRVLSRLCDAPPLTLCLLSLLRPDLCAAVSPSLLVPDHDDVVTWLKTTSANLPLDLRWVENKLRLWAEQLGEAMILACGALCAVDPPGDSPGPEDWILRRRAFVHRLVPEFDRVMDNMFCLYALRKEHFDVLCQQARNGRAAAIRALSLWPEKAVESAPALFRISREGTKLARRAAGESLDIVRARARVDDLAELEKRVDLASAWADAGLDGKPARVWWDISGYRVKLSVAAGKVTVETFSGTRRLASIPKAVRERPEHEEIRGARAELARSYRYFQARFEAAMVEGVRYSGRDFAILLANPVVRSLVSRLVLLVDGAPRIWTPVDPLADDAPATGFAGAGEVFIAHPLSLMRENTLGEWQQRVIDARISQPFKQVFRETYAANDSGPDGAHCVRFAGHALVARRAFALLRSRGYSPRRGDAVKDWSAHGLVAHVRWAADGEDAGKLLALAEATGTVTSGSVWFADERGRPIRLTQVVPVVVSETLRDADLLVSRAAAGEFGFTSEETLRLRATLIRYLARVLGMTTIYVADDAQYVLVEGTRAMYRVNLGSGSVLLEASRRHIDIGDAASEAAADLLVEGMDEGTARVLAVIATLARDHQIADAGFLKQVQGA
jgi:hypothetical protein